MRTHAAKERRPRVVSRSQRRVAAGTRAATADRAAIRTILRDAAIRTKLTVSEPRDAHEQEADRVAVQVMRMSEEGREAPTEIQLRKGDSPRPINSTAVAGRLSGLSGGGQPLPPDIRSFFEPRFGRDFGEVRIHADRQAAQNARDLGARAFTQGDHVVFDEGSYQPATTQGRRLLAHELTHVVQQRGGGPSTTPTANVQREVQIRPPGRGEASAFDRANELIDRMNAVSGGLTFNLNVRTLEFVVRDAAALNAFDTRMQAFIGRTEVVPMRLITGAGYVGGGPLTLDSLQLGYVDLDDLLASDDLAFESNIIHFLAERFSVRDYSRRLGTVGVGAAWATAHPIGLRAEAAFFADLFEDPSLVYNWENTAASGAYTAAFRSRDHGYHVFLMIRGGRRNIRGARITVRTRDGRRLTGDAFLAERRAALAAPIDPAAAGAGGP